MSSLSQSPKYLSDIWSGSSCSCSSPEKETASHLAMGRVKKPESLADIWSDNSTAVGSPTSMLPVMTVGLTRLGKTD